MPEGGGAKLVPTENYMFFDQAEQWGQSARKALTGKDGPLLNLEWKLWQRFRVAQARLREQQNGRSGSKSKRH